MSQRASDSLAPKEAAPVASKGFKCPNCGGPVNLELPGKSQIIRCPYCSSILEPTHDVLVLKEKYNEKFAHKMWIPLSAEGTLEGVKFKCVGMVVRGDDDGGQWSEYLLFNPYHGYRYLVESSGHWTLMQQSPTLGFDGSGRPGWYGPTGKMHIAGKKLKYFTHYRATVKNIIGEFPWQATIGEANEVTEYINPPYAASCETVSQYFDKKGKAVDIEALMAAEAQKKHRKSSDDEDDDDDEDDEKDIHAFVREHQLTRRITESNWSVGEYKYPDEIQAAFNLKEMPPKIGFGMCEPNPAKRRYMFSLAWTLLMFLATSVTCSIVSGRAEEKVVIAKEIQLNTADFELKNENGTDYLEFNFEPGSVELTRASNVEFDFLASLNQQWMSFNVFMINEETGEGYIYDTELSHYWGGSGEDSWSEGGNKADLTTIRMPAGTYYLYVAGATNVGVEAFKRYLSAYGTRGAIPITPVTSPFGKGKAGTKTPATTPKPEDPQAASPAPATPAPAGAEKRGKLLPEDFPAKASAPKFLLNMRAKRDVASVGMAVLFVFILLGFNLYYYIRYRMKEGER